MFGPKAVLIDRDDTIAPDIPYCDDPEKFDVFDYAPESIKKLNDAGYMVIVVTNQSGIGCGYFDVDTLSRIHVKMKSQIGEAGGHIDVIFYCPHSPEENCSCRKPEIGLGEQAIEKYSIATSRSFVIGDSVRDVEFGKGIGCRTFQVNERFTLSDAVSEIVKL
ncbi:MAG: HAD family hydrolase [Thermoplasmatales archaeon]|nr:HAD family hydrolase [Thermoplasmatales archaeon]